MSGSDLPAARPVVDADALAEALLQARCNIGPYKLAQSAIGDLDREHIDVLKVGTILSALRQAVNKMYTQALDALPVQDAADVRRAVAAEIAAAIERSQSALRVVPQADVAFESAARIAREIGDA